MSTPLAVEDLVSDWLRRDAPPRADGRLLSSVVAQVSATPQRRSVWERLIGPTFQLSPAASVLLLGALLVVGLGAAGLAAAALWNRTQPAVIYGTPAPTPSLHASSPSYEAVFLSRMRAVAAQPADLIVVSADGAERVLAGLGSAWPLANGETCADTNGCLIPSGAISHSGLLAFAGGTYLDMRWYVVDVTDPGAAPMAVPGFSQDAEQIQYSPYFSLDMRPGAFWGPGDVVAIPWYERIPAASDSSAFSLRYHVAFVDGHTGATQSVLVPDGKRVLPLWRTDGSGVLLGQTGSGAVATDVLLRDGTIGSIDDADAQIACQTEYQSGAQLVVIDGHLELRNSDGTISSLDAPESVEFGCLAPDGSAIATTSAVRFEVAGSWQEVDGGFVGWLESRP